MIQSQKSLALWWGSILGCGNERVICLFCFNTDQCIHLQRMSEYSPSIAECVQLNIVDTEFTLKLISSKQPVYTQWLDATIHIHILDLQYCVCMYYHLHLGALLHRKFWSTAIHTIWVRDDMAGSHYRAFGRQFAAYRLSQQFLVYIAQLLRFSISSSFSSISMTYHKQFQISQPCAWGLCGERCGWIHWWMWHDGRRLDRFVMITDCSFYDMYDITHLHFVSIFRHEYSFCLVT